MSNYEAHQRIFRQLRMHPWIPEHQKFIEAELAKLAVEDPNLGTHLAAQYDEKMAKYLTENAPEVTPPEAPVEVLPEAPVVPVETPVRKKRKYTKSSPK